MIIFDRVTGVFVFPVRHLFHKTPAVLTLALLGDGTLFAKEGPGALFTFFIVLQEFYFCFWNNNSFIFHDLTPLYALL